MANEGEGSQAGQEQGSGAGAGNGGTGTAQGAANTQQGQGSGGEGRQGRTDAEWQAELERREQENRAYREKIRKFEEAEAKRQQEGMSELEKRDARIRELEQQHRDLSDRLSSRDFADEVTKVARSLKFRDPDIAHRLVERRSVLADDGTVDAKKLTAALEDELRARPYLAGASGVGGGGDAGGGRQSSGAATSMNDLIRGRR